MAKAAKALCDRCTHRIAPGSPFCRSCGYPTPWANHDERTAWEVAQYRDKTLNVPIGVAYERGAKPTAVLEAPKNARRVTSMFQRRTHTPQLVNPEPRRAQPSVLSAVEPEPKPVARAKASKMDAEPARDTPATVFAMRMLNARVAELDAKVRELSSEIAKLRGDTRTRRHG